MPHGRLPGLWYTWDMDSSINIDVAALDPVHRQAMEDVLGCQLRANQRLIIQVASIEVGNGTEDKPTVLDLIEHFYDGLSDAEVEEIDRTIKTRADLTRHLP